MAWDRRLSWCGTHCLCPLGTKGWPQAQPSLSGHGQAVFSSAGVPGCLLQGAYCSTRMCNSPHTGSGTREHHMYTRAHRHAQVQIHTLSVPSYTHVNMCCRPAPVTGTQTLAHSHTHLGVTAKYSWGTRQDRGASRTPPERLPSLGDPDQTGARAPEPILLHGWAQGANPAAHPGRLAGGWGHRAGCHTPASPYLHLPGPESRLAPCWEHDGCT